MRGGFKVLARAAICGAVVSAVVAGAVATGSIENQTSRRTSESPSGARAPALRQAAPAAAAAKAAEPYVATVQGTLSPPVRDIPAPAPVPRAEREHEYVPLAPPPTATVADPVVQRTNGLFAMPTPSLTFEGVSNPVACAGCSPPDTEGDVGPNDYFEWVNTSWAIYDKTTGAIKSGVPKPGNTFFAPLAPHDCATQNAGDPLVLYDHLAGRWVISQFTTGNPATALGPYYQCVAVSTSSDPQGSYCLYPFQTPGYPANTTNWIFPDYGKISMWRDAGGTQDAYFFSFAGFPDDGTTFTPAAMAVERPKMITPGANNSCQSAKMVWFDASNSPIVVSNANQDGTERILPADLDGAILPPSGEPGYFYGPGLFGDSSKIEQWEFHVDWTTPSNSSFTLAHTISVPPYDQVFSCTGTRGCIPQLGTTAKLDLFLNPGRHRLMYRAAYRNFGTHRSVVLHHAADADTNHAGLRWYEIRDPEGTPDDFQAGTYAPDAHHRWMGSIAQDNKGNIAIGYSTSSATMNPAIRWAGQLASDLSNPANIGVLTQGEATMFAGTGSQTSTGSRWGDYTHMAVDPTDDCTFFYINEYYVAPGTPPSPTASSDWHTRIGKFKYPSCTPPTAATVLRLGARWRRSEVEVTWRTATETEAVGFNVYRSAGATAYRRVNRMLIPAKQTGRARGAAYRFADRAVKRGRTYTYRLQLVDKTGKRTWYGVGSAASRG